RILRALGANEPSSAGSPKATVEAAISALAQDPLQLLSVSRFYSTPAFPPGSGPDFVNAAVVVSSTLSPSALLTRLHQIEANFGRTRTKRWQSRTLDIDLLACGHQVVPDHATVRHWLDLDLADQKVTTPDQLILPHPRLQDRGFVLIPLYDIAPDWRHPILGTTVAEMVAALPEAEKAEIRPL
ncbi:MAG: 2-amino-4-hydroxy-6-hydroxymethyldihydropteridine diphosphokinase, partial [Tabrizicola sp.]